MFRQVAATLLFALIVSLTSQLGFADNYTWERGIIDNNWGQSSNWHFGVVPPTAQSSGTTTNVFMRGSGGSSDLADIANNDADWEIDSLTFESQATGSIDLIGGTLTLGNVFNNSTKFIRNSDGNTHSFSNDGIELSDPTFLFDADTADLDFNTNILFTNFGGSQTLSLSGGNDIFFDGGISTNGGDGLVSINESTTVHIRSSASGISQVTLSDGGLLRIGSNSNLSGGVNIITFSGTTFDVNGFTENVDQITGSGTIDLGGGSLTLGDSSNFTYSGSIIGTGTITKDQSGITTLSGVSTYTGLLNLTAGTLRLNNSTTDGSLSSGTELSVSLGATFDLNGVNDTLESIAGSGTIQLGGGQLTVDDTAGVRSFSGSITESGTLQKLGGHTLTLSGSNGFTSLIIDEGTVSVSSSNNLGSSSGTVTVDGTLNVSASFSNARTVLLDNGTFSIDSGDTLTQTGEIQNRATTASLTKVGSGTMVLGGGNTYTGDTILQSGRLEINNNERIGNSSDLIVNAGTFDLNNFTETVSGLSGSGGSIDTGGSSGRLVVNQSENLTYSGTIVGSGGLTKQGSGTLTLAGQNTYDGSTLIQNGTLQLASPGGLDSTTDVVVSTNGTFDLNGVSETVDSISGDGNIRLGGASINVDESSGTRTFSGVISETGSISKTGGHKLILSGNNTFTGGVLVFDGAISVGADNNLGLSSGDVTLAAGGGLETTGTFTTARDINFGMAANATIDTANGTTLTHTGLLNGGTDVTLTKAGGGTYVLNAANAGFGGDIVVDAGTFEIANFSGDALGNATRITVNSAGTLRNNQVEGFGSLAGSGNVITSNTFEVGFDNTSTTYSGVISGTVGGGFVGKAGTGIMTITQPQTYTGQTRINDGTLRLSSNGGLPNSSDVFVANTGTYDLNTESDTIDTLTGSGKVLLGNGALTLGNSNGSGTFSGVISEPGSVLSGAIIKVGSGVQALTGNNTYTSDTRIQGGTLQINDSNNLGSGAVIISNGARLQIQQSTTNARLVNLQTGGGVLDVAASQTVTQSGDVTGVGGLEKDGLGTLVLTSSCIMYDGDTDITEGTLQMAGAGLLPPLTNVNVASVGTWDLNGINQSVGTISGPGSVLLGNGRLTLANSTGANTTFSGIVSETGDLIMDGGHTLQLTGANTFTGEVSILDGTLSVVNNANLGNASNALTLFEGTLRATGSFTMPRQVSLTGDAAIDVPASELEISGVVGGAGILTKRGTGNLYLSGVNTYTGGTRIEDGSVQVRSSAGLGANNGAVTLATGKLIFTDEFTNLHQIVLEGGGAIDTTDQLVLQGAPITGTGTLTKFGIGEFELNAPATYQGNTIIEEGTLRLRVGGNLPDLFDVDFGDPTATFDLDGNDDTIDALLNDGTVRLAGATLTIGAGDGGGLFEGTMQGPGSVVKIGSGTQGFGGNLSHSSTDINGGTLFVSQDASLGVNGGPLGFDGGILQTTATFTMPRNVTLNPQGGTFNVDNATTLTVANPVTGPGSLTKIGGGTLILQAASNFGGPMSVLDGMLQIDTGMTVGGLAGTGSVVIGSNELIINNTGNDTFGGVISGVGGKLTKDGPGTLTLTGINTYNAGTCILDGVLRISQSENIGEEGALLIFGGGTLNTTASFGMTRGITVNAAGGTFDVDAGTLLGASGQITGVGGLSKIGDGTLQLSAISTYEGGTNILGGEVSIVQNVNLGNSAGQLTLDGGSLHNSASIAMARSTTLGAGGGTFRSDVGTTLTHTGGISGNAGSPGLTKLGPGNLNLGGNNTFTGDIYVEEGRLQFDTAGRLGNAANVVRMRGGTLNSLATLTNNREIQLEDGATDNTIEVASATTMTQGGVISDGAVGPPQTFAKAGGGTLRLTASNTYTSPTQINAGSIQLAGGGQLPDVTDVNVAVGATFDLNDVSDAIDGLSGGGDVTLGAGTLTVGADQGGGNFNGVISGTGGLVKVGAGTQQLRTREIGMSMFPNTYTGGTAINGGVLDVESDENLGDPNGNLSFDSGTLRAAGMNAGVNSLRLVQLNAGGGTIDAGDESSVTFNNVISGVGSMTKEGLGALAYGASNTYTGDTIINRGDLRLEGNGLISDSSNLIVNFPGVFDLNNIDDAVNGLSGNGEVVLGTGRLTMGAAGGSGNHSGVISGDGGITKSGAGMQTLSGLNTYMGTTVLNGGVLQVGLDANLGDSASTLIFDGGTLRTTGSFDLARNPTLGAGGGSIDAVDGTTLNMTAGISGIGGLTKLGLGTLRFTASNSYIGATQINSGIVELAGVERLANATDVTVASGATLNLAGFNETIDALDGAGNVLLGSAALNVGIDNGSGNFAGVINGTGDLLKLGSGVQTLSGQNTYSGATFVDGGELILSGGGQIDQSTTVVGFNIGSNGIATADGAGTTWDLSGELFVGLDGIGRMNIRNDAVVTVEGGITVGSNTQGPASMGTLSLDGGTLDNRLANGDPGNGLEIVNGTLQGHGTVIANITNSSTVAPGNSEGILDVTGDFIQALTGTLAIEIGGTDNANPNAPQFDVLNVSGAAALDGMLGVALINGFAPTPTDTFTIVNANLVAGTFSNAANGGRVDLTGGGTGSFQIDYLANAVVLSDFQGMATPGGDFDNNGMLEGDDIDALVAAIAGGSMNVLFDLTGDGLVNQDDLMEWLAIAGAANLPSGNPYLVGDATLDGFVDGQDFILWNSNKFTSLAAWTGGDFNADGFVDGQDFIEWNRNKFMSSDGMTAPVPEPAGAFGLLVALALLSMRARAGNRK